MTEKELKGFDPDELEVGYEFIHNGQRQTVERVFDGSNNSYVILTEDGVMKIYGEKVEVPAEQIGEWIMNITAYHERLAHYGVCVVALDQLSIDVKFNPDNNKVRIIHQTPFMGESKEDELLDARDSNEAIKTLRSIIKCLDGLFSADQKDMMDVGVDTAIRNFVGDDGGQAIYVDDVPPKVKIGKHYLLEIPEVTNPVAIKIGKYRHYSKAGLMHVLLVHACRLRPEFYPDFLREIERYLSRKKLGSSLEKFRNRLRSRTIVGGLEDIPLIKKLSFKNIYILREIACYYAYLGLLSRTQLVEFFKHSHFQHEPLSEESIKQLRKMLIEAINIRQTLVDEWNDGLAEALDAMGGQCQDRESIPYALERVSLAGFNRDLTKEGVNIVIVSGPTGVGKSFVEGPLEKAGFNRIPNVFTRDVRPGEQDGVDFIHMDEDDFLQAEREGEFLTTNRRHGYWHGLLRHLIEDAANGKAPRYMDKSVPSTLELLNHPAMSKIPCLTVYVLPPNADELVRRIMGRSLKVGQSAHEDVVERLRTSLFEFPESVNRYDLFLVHEIDSRRVADKILELMSRE